MGERQRFGRTGSYFYAAGIGRVRGQDVKPRRRKKVTFVSTTTTAPSVQVKSEADERNPYPWRTFLALVLLLMAVYFVIQDNTMMWALCITQGCMWLVLSQRKKNETKAEH